MRTDPVLLTPFRWELTRIAADAVTTVVDPGSAGFAGHFPGRPVVPGVCLIDLVCQAAAMLVLPVPGPVCEPGLAVERARFSAPVHGGDVLTVTITPSAPGPEPAEGATGLLAVVSRERSPVCRVRLAPAGARR